MNDEQRKEMFEALRGPRIQDEDRIAKLLEEIIVADLEKIEPIVDRLLIKAYKAGQRDRRHLTEEEIVRCCNEIQ